MLLRDKNAVIYGGGGAIGGAVARAFARERARVMLTGRTLAKLEQVAKEITAAGGIAQAAEVDALDEAAVEAFSRVLAGELGPTGIRVVCLRPDAIPEAVTISHTGDVSAVLPSEPAPPSRPCWPNEPGPARCATVTPRWPRWLISPPSQRRTSPAHDRCHRQPQRPARLWTDRAVASSAVRPQPLGVGGELFENVGQRVHAEARTRGHGDVAVVQGERLGDVARVVAVRR